MKQNPEVVNVIRHDYKERTFRYKNGRTKTIPEFYECRYIYKGREIGMYNSKDDVVYLNSRCIDAGIARKDWGKPVYERAMECEYSEAFKYLFAMLGMDKTTKMSEYFNL